MHTLTLKTSTGRAVRVHHNSDTSGEAQVCYDHPEGEMTHYLPADVVAALLEHSEAANPWAGVALVTVTHPRKLGVEAAERIKAQLERLLRPRTGAPILVFEEGTTLALHGEDTGHPVGVLQVPAEAVGLGDHARLIGAILDAEEEVANDLRQDPGVERLLEAIDELRRFVEPSDV